MQEDIVAACRCASSSLPLPRGVRTCKTEAGGQTKGLITRTLYVYLSLLINNSTTSYMYQCHSETQCGMGARRNFNSSCECQQPCHELKLHESVAFSSWPLERESKQIFRVYPERSDSLRATLTSEDDIKRALLKVDVYFGQLVTELSQERPAYTVRSYASPIYCRHA